MTARIYKLITLAILLTVSIGCQNYEDLDHNQESKVNASHDHPDDGLKTHWSGAEHLELGREGFLQACSQLNIAASDCPETSVYRKDQKVDLSYGSIVALGDFYDSAESAYNEKRVIKGLERIFKCIDEQGEVHAKQELHPDVEYPGCTWVHIFSGTEYLKLLSTNVKHFGWYNIMEYVKVHNQALNLALEAHQLEASGQIEEAEELFNKALFFNAYADHFLTDAFPAGHVRVPRKQLKTWAQKNLRGPLKGFVGDALGNMFHEFEGVNRKGYEVGMHVKNSLGQEWKTHSDGKLHHLSTRNDPVISYPIKAVSLSVQEVIRAYQEGVAPDGEFSALKLAPFPMGQPLSEKFALGSSSKENKKWVNTLRDGLAFPLKAITSKRTVKKAIRALKDIMAHMREDVKTSLNKNPELKRRMPEQYIYHFSNIQ